MAEPLLYYPGYEAKAIIFVDPQGYMINPDGTRGTFICQPNSAKACIVVDLDGNSMFG